jgi:hypothetical protein
VLAALQQPSSRRTSITAFRPSTTSFILAALLTETSGKLRDFQKTLMQRQEVVSSERRGWVF